MWGRRIGSALFIDYENVSHRTLPGTIQNWVAWLEDGEFDEDKRPRRFHEKRIYWNTMAEQHRDKFTSEGFTVVLCEKFSGLKNGADIRMALDIQEIMLGKPRIAEFILITRDSDFVPVLQRLALNSKRTAILVDEQYPQVHSTYSHFADIVIVKRKFLAATTYNKRPRSVLEWTQWLRAPRKPAKRDLLTLATDHVIRVTSLNPRQHTSRKEIEAELKKIPEFSTRGPNAYLGKTDYRDLMLELQKRSDRLEVTQTPGGGVNVRYIPKDEEE